ncbi:MAG: hypothetical protein HGB10_11195 [Coriobacteriia bacterium]|nr:hypothetical protein [Coriobacteriia bacterium]
MTETARTPLDAMALLLAEQGFTVGASSIGRLSMLATRKVRGLGPFFPVSEYFWVHDLSAPLPGDAGFERLHEDAREFVESRFSLPRPLRYHIPSTVSIGLSTTGFAPADIEFATTSKLRSQFYGGEKNSAYLIDLRSGEMHSAGTEATPVRYGGTIVSGVNPTNRALWLVEDLARDLMAKRPLGSGRLAT